MTYEILLKDPKLMLELTLRGKFAENPYVKNALDRASFHPLIRNYSRVPFS